MMPSSPAVVVPIALLFYDAASPRVAPIEKKSAVRAAVQTVLYVTEEIVDAVALRALVVWRKTELERVAADPQLLVSRRTGIHVHDDAVAAALAVQNGEARHVHRRAPVLHERFHGIPRTRARGGASPQDVSALIIVCLQQLEEPLGLPLLTVIVEDEIQRAAHRRQHHHRKNSDLDLPRAPLISRAVLIEEAGHVGPQLYSTSWPAARRAPPDRSCRKPPGPPPRWPCSG